MGNGNFWHFFLEKKPTKKNFFFFRHVFLLWSFIIFFFLFLILTTTLKLRSIGIRLSFVFFQMFIEDISCLEEGVNCGGFWDISYKNFFFFFFFNFFKKRKI